MPTTPHPVIAALPNAICWFRMGGSLLLMALAAGGYWTLVWCLILVLLLSDWIDGLIARRFSAISPRGPLLDSIADAAMYAAILVAAIVYDPATLGDYWMWIAMAAAAYCLHVLICIAKFQRWPSYHTRLAKAGWVLVVVALLGVVTGQAHWFVQVAAIAVTITNIEGMLITLLLPNYRANVASVLQVLN